jgi:hypothetical protein
MGEVPTGLGLDGYDPGSDETFTPADQATPEERPSGPSEWGGKGNSLRNKLQRQHPDIDPEIAEGIAERAETVERRKAVREEEERIQREMQKRAKKKQKEIEKERRRRFLR